MARALARATPIVESMRPQVDRNRAALGAWVEAHRDRVSWVTPPAGTVGFVRVKGTDVDVMAEELRLRHDTAVVPGRFFGDATAMRIGLGGDCHMVTEGLRRIGMVLHG